MDEIINIYCMVLVLLPPSLGMAGLSWILLEGIKGVRLGSHTLGLKLGVN